MYVNRHTEKIPLLQFRFRCIRTQTNTQAKLKRYLFTFSLTTNTIMQCGNNIYFCYTCLNTHLCIILFTVFINKNKTAPQRSARTFFNEAATKTKSAINARAAIQCELVQLNKTGSSSSRMFGIFQ